MEQKNILIIVIAIILTAVVAGGGVYYWQKSGFKAERQALKQQINELQNQVNNLQSQISKAQDKDSIVALKEMQYWQFKCFVPSEANIALSNFSGKFYDRDDWTEDTISIEPENIVDFVTPRGYVSSLTLSVIRRNPNIPNWQAPSSELYVESMKKYVGLTEEGGEIVSDGGIKFKKYIYRVPEDHMGIVNFDKKYYVAEQVALGAYHIERGQETEDVLLAFVKVDNFVSDEYVENIIKTCVQTERQ